MKRSDNILHDRRNGHFARSAHLALLVKCSVRLAALEDSLSRLKMYQSCKLSLVAVRGVLRSPEGILRRYRRKFRASAILVIHSF